MVAEVTAVGGGCIVLSVRYSWFPRREPVSSWRLCKLWSHFEEYGPVRPDVSAKLQHYPPPDFRVLETARSLVTHFHTEQLCDSELSSLANALRLLPWFAMPHVSSLVYRESANKNAESQISSRCALAESRVERLEMELQQQANQLQTAVQQVATAERWQNSEAKRAQALQQTVDTLAGQWKFAESRADDADKKRAEEHTRWNGTAEKARNRQTDLLQRLHVKDKELVKVKQQRLDSDVKGKQLEQQMQQLQQQAAAAREKWQCKMCLDSEVSVLVLPCGHLSLCSACATTMGFRRDGNEWEVPTDNVLRC